MIPIKIDNTHLAVIFEPSGDYTGWSEAQFNAYSIANKMYPSEVVVSAEVYSQDAERTANFEMEKLTIVNAKAKPEFTWSLIKAAYVTRLMSKVKFKYDYKDEYGDIKPEEAPTLSITYQDFTGLRTINAYLGQSISGTLVEYDGVLYWQDFRIAFPER